MFHIHFEKNIESKMLDKLKDNLSNRTKISQMEQNIQVLYFFIFYIFLNTS